MPVVVVAVIAEVAQIVADIYVLIDSLRAMGEGCNTRESQSITRTHESRD